QNLDRAEGYGIINTRALRQAVSARTEVFSQFNNSLRRNRHFGRVAVSPFIRIVTVSLPI
ncbi:hypothetical protein, partial [Evtepia sp.]|uniref:hypothetical protein n=1 Tax=Evtepia sp. TaxID=2773933 RepID=UPI002A80DB63